MKATQCDQILAGLKRGEILTAMSALNRYGCFRLAARIKDLRQRGIHIYKRDLQVNGKRFAAYTMDPR